MPGGRVYPEDDAAIYFTSSILSISLYGNSILKTISSRSLYSTFFHLLIISFLPVSRTQSLFFSSPIFIWFHLFLTSLTCNSVSLLCLISNTFCRLLTKAAPPLENQCPAAEVEKLSFSSLVIKTEFVFSKLVTSNSHFPSSERFFVGEKGRVSICLFSVIPNVSCGLDFVCSISVFLCFLIKSNNSLFILQSF